jgi:hypothetical protein
MRARKYVSHHMALYNNRTINVTPISMCYDLKKNALELLELLEWLLSV